VEVTFGRGIQHRILRPIVRAGAIAAFAEYGRRATGRHVGQDDFVRGAGTAQRDQAGRLLAVPTVTF
jgi:hypothetical protein